MQATDIASWCLLQATSDMSSLINGLLITMISESSLNKAFFLGGGGFGGYL